MSDNKVIKMFGNDALTAIMKEYQQLDHLGVVKVSKKQKLNVLNAIDLIKQKRCGKIKGRTDADGRQQRDLYSKSEVYSPALSLEGVLATLAIDAKEERHIAVADIPGAFLKADMPDLVIVKLQGPAVEAILKVNKQKYGKYVSYLNNKKKIIYVKLQKAMYGTLTKPLL